MPAFTVETLDGRRVKFGLDRALGFFAEIKGGGRKLVEYDALHPADFRFERPIEGLLYFLVKHSVFSEGELHDALTHFEDRHAGRLTPGAALAVEVITSLKAAAAD